VGRKNIPSGEYIYVNRLKEKWNIADVKSKKAKLLLSKDWVEQNQFFESKKDDGDEVSIDPAEPLKGSFLDIRNNYFRYKGHDVFIIVKDNVAWFRGNDVAKLLELQNPVDAVYHNVSEDDKTHFKSLGVDLNPTAPPNKTIDPQTMFITLEGVYDLIMASRKREARVFRRWLSHEVLPSINKFGFYSVEKRFGSFYHENDLFQYNDCNVCYIAHIGVHNQEPLFKFGITFDYHRREYQEHRKTFTIFELLYLRRTDNNRIVEDIFKKECLSKDLYRKIEKEDGKNITELFTINETHSLERMMSILNKIIEEHPTEEIRERDDMIRGLQSELKNKNELRQQWSEIDNQRKEMIDELRDRIREQSKIINKLISS